MMKLGITLGEGLTTTSDNKLTLKIKDNLVAPITLRDDGLYIPGGDESVGRCGIIDQHTLTNAGVTPANNIRVDVNSDVVVRIFSMCQFKCIDRSSKQNYRVSNEYKTIDDIVGELNAVIDAYGSAAIPMNVPRTSYIIKPHDLFQLRQYYMASQYTDGTSDGTWPVAMDSGNRGQNSPITALFYIPFIEYDESQRVTALTLNCLWSSIPSYTKGTAYNYG